MLQRCLNLLQTARAWNNKEILTGLEVNMQFVAPRNGNIPRGRAEWNIPISRGTKLHIHDIGTESVPVNNSSVENFFSERTNNNELWCYGVMDPITH